MADKIEPLSDPFKALLGSVGINPEKFNQGITARKLMQVVKGRHSTQRNNSAYYASANRLDTIASVAAKITKTPIRIYYPLGYVMFIRKAYCKNCAAEHTCMDAPCLYLLTTDKLGSSTKVYTPVATIDHPTLPHWIQEVKAETPFCLECYTTGVLYHEGEICPLAPSTETAGSEQAQPEPSSCQV